MLPRTVIWICLVLLGVTFFAEQPVPLAVLP
jgi:hypothetical protein